MGLRGRFRPLFQTRLQPMNEICSCRWQPFFVGIHGFLFVEFAPEFLFEGEKPRCFLAAPCDTLKTPTFQHDGCDDFAGQQQCLKGMFKKID